jgi:hypothetical protein
LHFALARDGQRILVNQPVEQSVVAPVTLVQNWTVGLGE